MIERLRAQLGDALESAEQVGDELRVRIEAAAVLTRRAWFCKEHGYTYPCDITAVDTGTELRMVYRLYSPVNRRRTSCSPSAVPRSGALRRLAWPRVTRRRTGWSGRSTICSACASRAIRICSGFCWTGGSGRGLSAAEEVQPQAQTRRDRHAPKGTGRASPR